MWYSCLKSLSDSHTEKKNPNAYGMIYTRPLWSGPWSATQAHLLLLYIAIYYLFNLYLLKFSVRYWEKSRYRLTLHPA